MRKLVGASVPLLAALVAFFFGAIMIVALGESPVEGFRALVDGSVGSKNNLAETAVRAAPLLLVGVGITIAFRASVINIGGEGQIIGGALLSTTVALALPDLPSILLIPLVLLAGLLGGAVWGAVPGVLKAYANVNEILSTIMLNLVAYQLADYLLRGPLTDKSKADSGFVVSETERLSDNAAMPNILPGTRLHLGVVIAVLAAIGAYILLWRTPLGFRLRAVGHSPDAARTAGIPVKRSIVSALALSGAMSGLAGAVLVFGSEAQRLSVEGGATGFTGSSGFNGIVAALFGGLHPLWTVPAAFLFGALLTGARELQQVLQIPTALAVALNGIVVIFVVSSGRLRERVDSFMDARREFEDNPDGDADTDVGSTEAVST